MSSQRPIDWSLLVASAGIVAYAVVKGGWESAVGGAIAVLAISVGSAIRRRIKSRSG